MSENHEIEWKILGIRKAKVIASIEKLWWVLDYKDRVLRTVRLVDNDWKKVRVRDHWAYIHAETKWKNQNNWKTKRRPEEIISVHCALDSWVKFYKSKWYKVLRRDVKTRTTYILDLWSEWWKVKLEIDEYSDLNWLEIPALLEIEATSEDVVHKVAKLLWFNDNDLKDWGTTTLFQYYYEKNNKNKFKKKKS